MNAESENLIKKPDVDGQFYEKNPSRLSSHIQQMMDAADLQPRGEVIDVLMVPHAGHVYSGPTAAYGFKAVQDKKIKTVILLGPTHYYRFSGVAIWPQGEFRTPLGALPIDEEMAAAIQSKAAFVRPQAEIFKKDHVLEVEMPFLQHIYKGIQIVPMIMNRNATSEEVQLLAKALNEVVGVREDVLLLISTDQAHYHPAKENEKIDRYGLKAVEDMDVERIWKENAEGKMEIDGFKEVIVGLLYAQLRGSKKAELLNYSHSGMITGDDSKVVGYAAMIFHRGEKEDKKKGGGVSSLSMAQKKKLMDIARSSIENYVGKGKKISVKEKDARLNEEEGAFVSIYKDGKLRGCIGNILGSGPLCLTVRNMAMASATKDTRFKPIDKNEIDDIDLEISVLSKPRVAKPDEIVLGKHGVIVSRGGRSGVFLPQVADSTGWDMDEFMGQLCSQKAGLPWDCWKDPETKIEIYTAEVFSEKDLK